MKLIACTAAAFALSTPATFAQTAPAPAAARVSAPLVVAKFSADTPIEALFANEAAKAVLVADGLGDVEKHPAYEQFKTMSFRAVAPYSEGKLTDALLAKLDTDLARIK